MPASDRHDHGIAAITGNARTNEPADFERAISATGYGLFNVLLLLAALPIAWTATFDTTSGAFILASAECDLQLTFLRKGVLVAFPYVAMTTTSFIWDHVTPYTGVRTLLILGLLADSILNIVSTGLRSYYMFLLVKFVSGILVGGPLAMVMTYLTEFHSTRYKPRFSTWAGLLFVAANVVPAEIFPVITALGFTILPLNWHIDVFGMDYDSWRIYLLICSIPPVVGLVTASMLPESPKRLMTIGKSDDALKLLRMMYCMNTRQPAETFPIKALCARRKQQSARPVLEASLERMRVSLYNAKLLFSNDYLAAFCIVSFLQFGSMLGFHTMRLWVPHLFIILNNFDAKNWSPEGREPTICEMLDRRAALPGRQYLNCTNFHDACFKWTVNPSVYQNSTTIASSAVIFSFLAGFVMDTRARKQIIILTAFLISLGCCFGINWAQAPPYMLTLAAAVIVTTRIAGNIVAALNADVIPAPLRATSVSVLATIGNVAAIAGNLTFSALLGAECIAAFTGLGCFFAVCFCVSLFLPQAVRESPRKLAGDGAAST